MSIGHKINAIAMVAVLVAMAVALFPYLKDWHFGKASGAMDLTAGFQSQDAAASAGDRSAGLAGILPHIGGPKDPGVYAGGNRLVPTAGYVTGGGYFSDSDVVNRVPGGVVQLVFADDESAKAFNPSQGSDPTMSGCPQMWYQPLQGLSEDALTHKQSYLTDGFQRLPTSVKSRSGRTVEVTYGGSGLAYINDPITPGQYYILSQ